MKNLVEFMTESFKAELNNVNEQNINEGEIKDEKEFREYAHAKLKEAFGDDYDEAKANEMVDGILEDNKEEEIVEEPEQIEEKETKPSKFINLN